MIRGKDWLFLLGALAGAAFFFDLGLWQVNRLEWKRGLIAHMEAAVAGAAPAISLEQAAARFVAEPGTDYVLVTGQGQFQGPTRWLYSIVDGRPGWKAVTPVGLGDGRVVLLDRGAVLDEMRGQSLEVTGAISFTGFARKPQGQPGLFTPADAPDQGLYYWRNAAGMGGLSAYPFFVEVQAQPGQPVWPRPEKPDAGALPNNHLGYAVTWFSFSLVLPLLTGCFLWTRRKTST